MGGLVTAVINEEVVSMKEFESDLGGVGGGRGRSATKKLQYQHIEFSKMDKMCKNTGVDC